MSNKNSNNEKTDIELSKQDDQVDLDHEYMDDLTPAQLKAARMLVFSPHLTNKEVAKMLNKSARTLRNWKNQEGFQKYLVHIKKQHEKDLYKENIKKNAYLNDKIFGELVDRMETDPDPEEDLDDHATQREKRDYMEKFIDGQPFDKVMKFWDMIDKKTRLDQGEATSRVDNQLVGRISDQFEELMKERKKYRSFKQKEGISNFEDVHGTADIIEADFEKVEKDNEEQDQEQGEEASEDKSEQQVLNKYKAF